MPTLRVPVKYSSSSFSDDHSSEIFKVTMRYFHLFRRKKSEERKARKSVSDGSNSSAYMSMSTDHDTRRSGSEINSQNVSDFRTANEFFEEDSAMSHWDSNLREFKLSELKKATNNFSPSLIIGEGGFGCVYRGEVGSSEDPNKKIDVAVKQLGRRGLRGHKEWLTEISVLGVVEHQNLVKLVGYCAEDDEQGIHRLLVYEYMPNRSVSDHLSSRCHTPLPWRTRIRIARDAARGLAYLHEGMDFQIIFRDFKSSNILLDDQWNAKLSDFGLARLGPAEGLSHVTTAVVGTVGYAAPEYIHTGRLTSKSDVWAYGVFLYELITGRRPLDRNRPKNQQKLLDWVWAHLSDPRRFRLIMDPRLEGKYNIKSAQKLAAVANWCLALEAKARPKMSEVLEMVTKIVDGTETESPQLPVKSLAPKDAPETCIKERLKRFVNPISRENGCLAWRTSSQKLVG